MLCNPLLRTLTPTLCFVLQVMSEVTSFLKMMDEVYTIFGLDYTMALSTRPEGYLGEHQCESALLKRNSRVAYGVTPARGTFVRAHTCKECGSSSSSDDH
jgi:threonyl-tRNA synthetase